MGFSVFGGASCFEEHSVFFMTKNCSYSIGVQSIVRLICHYDMCHWECVLVRNAKFQVRWRKGGLEAGKQLCVPAAIINIVM